MADGKITGKDIIDDSAFRRIDELIAKLDESIKKFREIEKSAKVAFSNDNIVDLSRDNEKLAQETDKTVKSIKEQNEVIKEQIRQEKALERARAQASQAGSDTNRQIQEERAARNAINKDIRDEIKLRRQQQTAYGRLSADVNRLEKEYKELAAAQKLNTTEGKALTKEFQAQKRRLDAINRSAGDFRSNVGNYPSAFRGATTAIRQFVGAFGLVEGIRLGGDFIRDSIELAAQARTVELAFNNLGAEGVRAFNDIQRATRGTISTFDTLTSINEFANFNIDLEESGVLFEFLALRAAQTGRSIDSLRDSLVEGLSKESKLRIDNLGISTAALNAELEKTPNFVEAVANIAREELGKDGAQAILEELAKSPEAATAAFEDLKLAIGQSFDGLVGVDFSGVTFAINTTENAVRGLSDGLGEVFIGIENFSREIGALVGNVPVLGNAFLLLRNLFTSIANNTTQILILGFARLGATISGLGAGVRAILGDFQQLFNAFVQLGRLDFSNLTSLAGSIQSNLSGLGNAFTSFGSDAGTAYSEAFDAALAASRERQQDIQKEREKAAAAKSGAEAGQEFSRALVKGVEDASKEYETLIKAFRLTDGDEIQTEATLQGLEEIAQKAEEVANRTKTSSESLAASLLEINEETFELAEGLFSQFQNLTGISSEVFSDLAFDTADTDTAFQAIEGLGQRAFDAQQQRLDEQLAANQDYLQQIRSDERLSAEEKIALEQRVAEEEKRIRQEQAKAQRQIALFSVAIDTARAIAKVLADANFITALPRIATITAIGAAQAALIASQPLPQFFKGKGPLDNYEGLATWGERGQEVLVTPGGEMYVSPNKTTPLYVGKDDIIVPSFSQFDRELNSKGEVFNRLQNKMSKETREREEFNYKQFEKSVYSALKRAGVGPVNINLDARRYRY